MYLCVCTHFVSRLSVEGWIPVINFQYVSACSTHVTANCISIYVALTSGVDGEISLLSGRLSKGLTTRELTDSSFSALSAEKFEGIPWGWPFAPRAPTEPPEMMSSISDMVGFKSCTRSSTRGKRKVLSLHIFGFTVITSERGGNSRP